MQKILFLCTLSLFILQGGFAQESSRTRLIEAIKKEKLRKPVKLDGQNISGETSLPGHGKTRATDLKVSNTNSGNEEGEAQICIDPSNPNNLVMSYMNNTASGNIEYPVYRSSNGGDTWTKSTFNAFGLLNTEFPGALAIGGGDPVFAYDKNGNLYFSWIYLVANSTFDTVIAAMYWAKSTDNGATFTLSPGDNHFLGKSLIDPNSPNLDPFPGSDGFYDRQWFAADQSSGPSANAIYASFIYFNTPSESPALTGSTIKKLQSGGSSFGPKKQAISGSIQFNNVRVDNTGVLHLSGADVDNNIVVYCKSTDGGNTFSSAINVYSGTNLFGSQGGGYIHDRENAAVNMEVDGAKNVHLVWSDFEATPGPNYKSYYSRLNNGSSSFTSPLNLNTLFPPGYGVFMPVVCTYGNKVSIGAYVIDASKVSDYYIVNSDNNGNTWSAPVKLSSGSTDFASASNTTKWFGDYYNSVRTANDVYSIWSDGRGTGGPKMYVSRAKVWPTGVVDMTPVNSSLQLESIYPNPVESQLTLSFIALENEQLELTICSVDGKTLLAKSMTLNKGNQQVSLPLPQMAAGSYLLKIKTQDGFTITRHFEKK